MKSYFKDLAIGQHFTVNGTPYIKKSTRTATAAPGHLAAGKWFYFGQYEAVTMTVQ